MTVRHDCDQSERVPAEHSSHLLFDTESLLSLLLFTFLIEILTMFTLYNA